MLSRRPLVLVLLQFATSPTTAQSGDWPQFLGGADRPAAATARKLRIPEGWRPKILWRRTIGSGYSSISVLGTRAVIMFSDGGQDWTAAIDTSTGKEFWRFKMEPMHRGHDGSMDGPLSTPAIDETRAYVLSARGRLFALALADGRLIWQKDLVNLSGARAPYFGFATSPLIDGESVVVMAGGGDGKSLLALDRKTGELKWSAQSDRTDNSSPLAVTLGGVRQIVALNDNSVFAVRSSDGKFLWRVDGKTDGWATPLALGKDRLLLPMGSALRAVRCKSDGDDWRVEKLWEISEFRPQGTFLAVKENHIYGTTKRYTVCIDIDTGSIEWRRKSFESSAILVGDFLFMLSRRLGELRVVAARSDRYQELSTSRLFQTDVHYTPPSFADGKLFLRSVSEFLAIDLADLSGGP